MKAGGVNSSFFKCDVTKEEEIQNLKRFVKENYKRVDILFNNAGVLLMSRLEDISPEEWKYCFEVNTNSYMYMVKAFIDMLIDAKGCIINNASIAGLQSNISGKSTYMYASSKAATIQFSQLLALNYSDRIRVNCLCPGVTRTNIFTNRDFSRFDGKIPIGRVAEPIEIARVALFLASEEASYITGAVVNVDGGASLLSSK